MRCKYVGHKERAMEEEERVVEASQVVGREVSVDLPVLLLVLGCLEGGRGGAQNVEQNEGKHGENQEDHDRDSRTDQVRSGGKGNLRLGE